MPRLVAASMRFSSLGDMRSSGVRECSELCTFIHFTGKNSALRSVRYPNIFSLMLLISKYSTLLFSLFFTAFSIAANSSSLRLAAAAGVSSALPSATYSPSPNTRACMYI